MAACLVPQLAHVASGVVPFNTPRIAKQTPLTFWKPDGQLVIGSTPFMLGSDEGRTIAMYVKKKRKKRDFISLVSYV